MAFHAMEVVACERMRFEPGRNLVAVFQQFHYLCQRLDLRNVMAIAFEVFLESGGGFYNHYSSDLQNASKEEVSTDGKSLPRAASSIAARVSALGSL